MIWWLKGVGHRRVDGELVAIRCDACGGELTLSPHPQPDAAAGFLWCHWCKDDFFEIS